MLRVYLLTVLYSCFSHSSGSFTESKKVNTQNLTNPPLTDHLLKSVNNMDRNIIGFHLVLPNDENFMRDYYRKSFKDNSDRLLEYLIQINHLRNILENDRTISLKKKVHNTLSSSNNPLQSEPSSLKKTDYLTFCPPEIIIGPEKIANLAGSPIGNTLLKMASGLVQKLPDDHFLVPDLSPKPCLFNLHSNSQSLPEYSDITSYRGAFKNPQDVMEQLLKLNSESSILNVFPLITFLQKNDSIDCKTGKLDRSLQQLCLLGHAPSSDPRGFKQIIPNENAMVISLVSPTLIATAHNLKTLLENSTTNRLINVNETNESEDSALNQLADHHNKQLSVNQDNNTSQTKSKYVLGTTINEIVADYSPSSNIKSSNSKHANSVLPMQNKKSPVSWDTTQKHNLIHSRRRRQISREDLSDISNQQNENVEKSYFNSVYQRRLGRGSTRLLSHLNTNELGVNKTESTRLNNVDFDRRFQNKFVRSNIVLHNVNGIRNQPNDINSVSSKCDANCTKGARDSNANPAKHHTLFNRKDLTYSQKRSKLHKLDMNPIYKDKILRILSLAKSRHKMKTNEAQVNNTILTSRNDSCSSSIVQRDVSMGYKNGRLGSIDVNNKLLVKIFPKSVLESEENLKNYYTLMRLKRNLKAKHNCSEYLKKYLKPVHLISEGNHEANEGVRKDRSIFMMPNSNGYLRVLLGYPKQTEVKSKLVKKVNKEYANVSAQKASDNRIEIDKKKVLQIDNQGPPSIKLKSNAERNLLSFIKSKCTELNDFKVLDAALYNPQTVKNIVLTLKSPTSNYYSPTDPQLSNLSSGDLLKDLQIPSRPHLTENPSSNANDLRGDWSVSLQNNNFPAADEVAFSQNSSINKTKVLQESKPVGKDLLKHMDESSFSDVSAQLITHIGSNEEPEATNSTISSELTVSSEPNLSEKQNLTGDEELIFLSINNASDSNSLTKLGLSEANMINPTSQIGEDIAMNPIAQNYSYSDESKHSATEQTTKFNIVESSERYADYSSAANYSQNTSAVVNPPPDVQQTEKALGEAENTSRALVYPVGEINWSAKVEGSTSPLNLIATTHSATELFTTDSSLSVTNPTPSFIYLSENCTTEEPEELSDYVDPEIMPFVSVNIFPVMSWRKKPEKPGFALVKDLAPKFRHRTKEEPMPTYFSGLLDLLGENKNKQRVNKGDIQKKLDSILTGKISNNDLQKFKLRNILHQSRKRPRFNLTNNGKISLSQ